MLQVVRFPSLGYLETCRLITDYEEKTMYKSLIFVFLVGVVSVCADIRKFKVQSNHIQRVIKENDALDWCPQCIETFNELIDVVLNIILEVGVYLNSFVKWDVIFRVWKSLLN